jgi:membrane associated rhomboid family serine protease
MDWALVLLSQGIEPTIELSEEQAAWELVIDPACYERALESLRLYQLENRRWPWRREVLRPGLLFDWAVLAWVLLVVFFFWLQSSASGTTVRDAGFMDGTAVSHGQWWRLFTAVWLHADVAHLASNATIGFVLLGLALARYGTGAGLLAAYLAGAAGNFAAWLLAPPPHYSLGASGMVMGSLGLLAIQSLSLWRRTPHAHKHLVSSLAGGILLFVFWGVSPESDVLAHFGGFIGGLLLGAALSSIPNLARGARTNTFAGILFVLLVVWPWWLALSQTAFRPAQ